MGFDWAATKKAVRRTVHNTFGVTAFYQDDSYDTPQEVKARWHSKIDRFGDLEGQGYAELIQGIDRIIVAAEDARRLNFVRGGTITFNGFGAGLGVGLGAPLGGDGIADPTFELDTREPSNGPYEEIWLVSVKETA